MMLQQYIGILISFLKKRKRNHSVFENGVVVVLTMTVGGTEKTGRNLNFGGVLLTQNQLPEKHQSKGGVKRTRKKSRMGKKQNKT